MVNKSIEEGLEKMLNPAETESDKVETAFIRDFKEIIDDDIVVMAGHYAKKNNIELVCG